MELEKDPTRFKCFMEIREKAQKNEKMRSFHLTIFTLVLPDLMLQDHPVEPSLHYH
jgi:hypothetical protein